MKNISSVQNPLIKTICKLQTAQGRKQAKQFVVEGHRTVQTFIEHGYKPVYLFVTEKNKATLSKMDAIETFLVSDLVMNKISSAVNPSGILCIFAMPKNPEPAQLGSGLVLANITDPGNMGTLIRSAAAFGAQSVVIIDGCDVFSPKVLQATAGALPLIKLFIWNWQELLQNKKNLELCALVVTDGTNPEKITKNSLLVVGNEAHGLPAEWANSCDQKITLPMTGNTESLNAGVAGSIALYLLSTK